jgi:hypothetical protein
MVRATAIAPEPIANFRTREDHGAASGRIAVGLETAFRTIQRNEPTETMPFALITRMTSYLTHPEAVGATGHDLLAFRERQIPSGVKYEVRGLYSATLAEPTSADRR